MPKNTTTYSVSSIGPDKDYNTIKHIHLNAKQPGKQLPHKAAVIERDTGHVKMFFDSRDARAHRDEVGGIIFYPGTGPDIAMIAPQNKYKTSYIDTFNFHDMYDNIMVPRPALTHGAKQYQTISKDPFPHNL